MPHSTCRCSLPPRKTTRLGASSVLRLTKPPMMTQLRPATSSTTLPRSSLASESSLASVSDSTLRVLGLSRYSDTFSRVTSRHYLNFVPQARVVRSSTIVSTVDSCWRLSRAMSSKWWRACFRTIMNTWRRRTLTRWSVVSLVCTRLSSRGSVVRRPRRFISAWWTMSFRLRRRLTWGTIWKDLHTVGKRSKTSKASRSIAQWL